MKANFNRLITALMSVLFCLVFYSGCELDTGLVGTDAMGDLGLDMTDGDVELLCGEDDYCDPLCDSDPDCFCDCDIDEAGVCNALGDGTDAICDCDPDCIGDMVPCTSDLVCDENCPEATDPDCFCECDYYVDVCESAEQDSADICICDIDCADGGLACQEDDHCDTWCPEDVDPDCECECDYYDDVCEAEEDGTTDACYCDSDCGGDDFACVDDGHCDTWCDPEGVCEDPDCVTFLLDVCSN